MLIIFQLELEHRGLADEVLGLLRILNAGKLHQNFVLAFLDDGGFTHAQLVDSVADSFQRLLHRVGFDLVGLHRFVIDDVRGRAAFGASRGNLQIGKRLRYDVVEGGDVGIALERDHQRSASGILRDVGVELVFLEFLLEIVAAPLELRLDRLLDLHRHQQMGPALQIET